MKQYTVHLTKEAEEDLLDLFEYIAVQDSVQNAYQTLDQLEALITSLDQSPERGHYPSELLDHGIKSFREVLFKPYRVIYEVKGKQVFVLACLDSRRSLQLLLQRRVLR